MRKERTNYRKRSETKRQCSQIRGPGGRRHEKHSMIGYKKTSHKGVVSAARRKSTELANHASRHGGADTCQCSSRPVPAGHPSKAMTAALKTSAPRRASKETAVSRSTSAVKPAAGSLQCPAGRTQSLRSEPAVRGSEGPTVAQNHDAASSMQGRPRLTWVRLLRQDYLITNKAAKRTHVTAGLKPKKKGFSQHFPGT